MPWLADSEPTTQCVRIKADGTRCKNLTRWKAHCRAHGGNAPTMVRLARRRRALWLLGYPVEFCQTWRGTDEQCAAIGAAIIERAMDQGSSQSRLEAARTLLDLSLH